MEILTPEQQEHLRKRLASCAGTPAVTPPVTRRRRPVHTMYGGAHMFSRQTAAKVGRRALAFLEEYAPTASHLARALGISTPGTRDPILQKVFARVREKLAREPVEDYRVDFEDGYGVRSDDEEDHHARHVGREIGLGAVEGTLPPSIGVRIRPLHPPTAERALRTLTIVLSETILAAGSEGVPSPFLVALPKVADPAEVSILTEALAMLEEKTGLAPGTLQVELMIEDPRTLLGPTGLVPLSALVNASNGRCVALHLGAYDLTGLAGVSAPAQSLGHPFCDLARGMMALALAGSPVERVDGVTTELPIPPHSGDGTRHLSPAQKKENREAVYRAWRKSFHDIRRALDQGFHRGWDIHPHQLPVRYATVFEYFLRHSSAMAERLNAFLANAARATHIGGAFDDAATGQALLEFFLRALACSALTPAEVKSLTGLSDEDLIPGSFSAAVERRAQA